MNRAFLVVIVAYASSVSAAYKCEVNGEIIYSQTQCAPGAETVRVDPGPSTSAGSPVRGGVASSATQGMNKQLYEIKKNELLEKMRRIDLGKNQPMNQRANNKKLYETYQTELRMLEREYLATTNPAAASNQHAEESMRDLEKKIDEQNRSNKRPFVRPKTIYMNGEYNTAMRQIMD